MVPPGVAPRGVEALHGVCLDWDDCPSGAPAGGLPTLVVRHVARIPLDPAAQPLWAHAQVGDRHASRFALYTHPAGDLLDIACEGRGRLLVGAERIDVAWAGGTAPAHYLRTTGLALWLERRGIPCLHANALVRDGCAIGLLAPSQTGKTTLSAAFVQAGWHLLTDDMAAAYRQPDGYAVFASDGAARMWPDSGAWFHGDAFAAFPRVHARFAKRRTALARRARAGAGGAHALQRLYVLEREPAADGAVRIEPLPPGEALLALARDSILGHAVRALGMEQQRLARLADLAAGVAVRRVRYPSGFAHLQEITRAIEQDAR